MCLHMMTEKLFLEWTTLWAWHVNIPFLIPLSQHSKRNTSPAHGCQGQDINHCVKTRGGSMGKRMALPPHPEQLESESATKTHSSIFEFESGGESLKMQETTATTQAYAQVHKPKMTTKNGPSCRTLTLFKLGCTRSHQVADLKSS